MAQVLNSQIRVTGRRSAFEIMMDILRVAAAGSAKPTHIMYKSNTSWAVLQKNLESLVAAGFIREGSDGSRLEYQITERGMAVLEDYLKLIDRTRPFSVEVSEQ